ncbi:MAG: hypothetical protein DRH93_01640, partial [Deltaproteobacteria bacterium]
YLSKKDYQSILTPFYRVTSKHFSTITPHMIYQFSLSSLTFCNYHAMEKLYKYLIFKELGSFAYEKNVLELGKKCTIL